MACEDYPCCGHQSGDCPRIDSKGRERWRCVGCGKTLPLSASSSYCNKCQNRQAWNDPYEDSHDGAY
jgi:hypothetical protein